MALLREIAARCVDANFRQIYQLIDGKLPAVRRAEDGTPLSGISHTSDEVAEIKRLQYASVLQNHSDGFTTLGELERSVKLDLTKMVKDGFANPVTGFGTGVDPSMYGAAYTPILMSPEESTALYSSGGLAKVIIDKKSKGVLLNGFDIKSALFEPQQLADLRDYAISIGFAQFIADLVRDGNIYGGAEGFPTLVGDAPITMSMTVPQLWQNGMLGKHCIRYFSVVDRWNTVTIPTYDLCAQDYLKPTTFYVPISGIEVHTSRSARCIPNPQPYWSAIRNLGWGTPDFISYARALTGYELMAVSLPVMCQQMSLIVHELPLDGIIAQNGPEAAKAWQKENEKQLRDWSILNPKAINSYGKITVVDRTYAGFDNLIDAIRKDVSSKCGIPESVLFFSQPNGIFNKNEEDVLLKQSETIRMVQRTVAPAINGLLPIIACSLWGCPDWDTFERYKTLQIDFDTPVVSSPSQKAEIGFKYASTIKILVDCGVNVRTAMGIASKMVGEVEMPSDLGDELATVVPAPLQIVSSASESITNGAFGGMSGQSGVA